MAANLNIPQQMGMPPQQQRRNGIPSQLTAIVYQQLVANTPVVSGWRAGVQFPERMGKTVNLITNIILANPGIDWQKAVQAGLDFERKAFLDMPDRIMYDKQMNTKISEQFVKRQVNGQNLRNDLNNHQIAHAQQQALQQQVAVQQQQQQQQQQMLMAAQNPMLQAQLRAFGQNQGFQHMQHPMQGTPISQPQQMGVPMAPNTGGMQMAPNQQPMQMNMNAMRPNGNMQHIDLSKLSDADRMKVNEFAQRLYMNTDENTKRSMLASVQSRMSPQTIHSLQRQGKDLVMHMFQVQALNVLTNKAQTMRAQMPGQDVNQAQQRMQLQQKAMASGVMNPGMMNVSGSGQPGGLGGGPTGPAAGQSGQYPFSTNMETIMNEQKAGMLAQEAGQVVVPASSGQPGRNATPQPQGSAPGGAGGGMSGQNRPGAQQGQNQGQHGSQMPQQFNMPMGMDAVQANAQNQQRGGVGPKQMQAQQGAGLGHSPGMGTMSTPMARQPTGQGDSSAQQHQHQQPQTPQQQQQQLAQGGPYNGQMDPRFGQRPSMSVPANLGPAYQNMLNSMTPEQRDKLSSFPPDKLNELMARWVQGQQQQHNLRTGKLPTATGQAQLQTSRQGQMGTAQPNNQAGGAPGQFGVGQQMPGVPSNMALLQQQRQMMRPQAIDNMDLPTQVTSRFALPPDVKKWCDLKAWIAQNNIPEGAKNQLLNLQMMQFRQIMDKKNALQQAQLAQQRTIPTGMPAGAPGAPAMKAGVANGATGPQSGGLDQSGGPSGAVGPNAKKLQMNRQVVNNRKRPSSDEVTDSEPSNAPTQRSVVAAPSVQQQQQQLQQQRLKKDEVWKKILETADPLVKVGKQLGRFYMATRDEVRTHRFFRTRYRISQQFSNPETLSGRRPNFSITVDEIESHRNLLIEMGREAMNHVRKAQASLEALNQHIGQKMSQMPQSQSQMPGIPPAGQAADVSIIGASSTQTVPAPLNQANLEENNRVLNKMQNRTNSKSGMPPAAPTTAQPPFSLHATSPHGQPAYIGKPAVTQENLHLPASKRRKTGGQATAASPATTHTPAATTPSQKVPSPDARRHGADATKAQAQPSMTPQHPSKPLLYCTEADCDTKTTGFATEEARRVHIEEEHTKPNANPMKFVTEALTDAFGLDADGKAKGASASAANGAAAASTTMAALAPRQGPAPATPMSRVASMNRQASAASGVGKGASGGLAGGMSGKTGSRGDASTLKVSDGQLSTGAEGDAQLPIQVEDPWDLAMIDPHELSNAFSFTADTVANGAIADFSIYLNSLTPNDTPESKADSGWSSEPTSDISESIQVDNGLDLFTAGDGTIMPSMLDSMPRYSMQPSDENDAADFAQMYLGDAPGICPLDTDMTEMFSKSSIELDPDLYQFR
ncbi:hypothetical protein CMQ_7715 [Grosmannia clavigera kw1407]|uniref:Uncharacterized protein n=1 Tax=Grosmannia clavigera (strain kw1407 / UAMH 11150) TaxID=655863 RepID=F0XPZ6_GROCL|nr:uncharacterized protein CMQ_7715 [Grosmannia clavigera kw1407]EFX00713.1 hypothetical protein CMQ_7715 [Grosmannia clavigera kw1407]